jgi:hypothetical protein
MHYTENSCSSHSNQVCYSKHVAGSDTTTGWECWQPVPFAAAQSWCVSSFHAAFVVYITHSTHDTAYAAGLSIKGITASGCQWSPSAFLATGVDSADTHDDFKPKQSKPAGPDQEPNYDQVRAEIEKDISQHDVFLYMKGIPRAPQCGFSNLAVRVLDAYGG